MPEELSAMPTFPVLGRGAWDDFLDLHNTRGSGLNGPERLSFADLYYWQKVIGVKPEAWVIRAIFKIDQAYITQAYKTDSD